MKKVFLIIALMFALSLVPGGNAQDICGCGRCSSPVIEGTTHCGCGWTPSTSG